MKDSTLLKAVKLPISFRSLRSHSPRLPRARKLRKRHLPLNNYSSIYTILTCLLEIHSLPNTLFSPLALSAGQVPHHSLCRLAGIKILHISQIHSSCHLAAGVWENYKDRSRVSYRQYRSKKISHLKTTLLSRALLGVTLSKNRSPSPPCKQQSQYNLFHKTQFHSWMTLQGTSAWSVPQQTSRFCCRVRSDLEVFFTNTISIIWASPGGKGGLITQSINTLLRVSNAPPRDSGNSPCFLHSSFKEHMEDLIL